MIRRVLFRGVLPVVGILLVFVAYVGIQLHSGNFHEVIEGKLYRSSQLTDAQLSQYVKANGIRTIINLRGENAGSEWYKDETATADKLGVEHVDFGMSARKKLSMPRVAQLIQIMRNAPKPILIHCKSGADRTGLASAIYVNRVAGLDENIAERQLSIWFGHLGIPYLSSTYAMDRSWEDIERAKTLKTMVDAPEQLI